MRQLLIVDSVRYQATNPSRSFSRAPIVAPDT
jgi:hypothetical protein